MRHLSRERGDGRVHKMICAEGLLVIETNSKETHFANKYK